MQVTCFGFDWDEVLKRPSAAIVVKEMILNDDIDKYSKELPDGIWLSDSAMQHFETGEELAEFCESAPAKKQDALRSLCKLISNGESLDELGLSPLTEGCYFISLSPATARALLEAIRTLDIDSISDLSDDAKEWIGQWVNALEFADKGGFGLIGHCG